MSDEYGFVSTLGKGGQGCWDEMLRMLGKEAHNFHVHVLEVANL